MALGLHSDWACPGGQPRRQEGCRMKTAFYGFGTLVIVLLLLALFTLFQNPGRRDESQEISFSQLLSEVDQGRVRDVLIQGPDIYGTLIDGRGFQTYAPGELTLAQRLYAKGVSISARAPVNNLPWFMSLIIAWLPFIVTLGVW